ncbi:TIR domain-containing protein [Vibrio lentus]|uniref:Putative nucleotide-binding protein containing TIR-like domain-containing protein n=1 Tax=Vibrio tapetis subsp. tapetis TaxID=1671868 RepID=A0A2N8ZE93_9VIBR|nr:TIR domain-containing protein [Vibrio tapetis]SON50234.1 putative nucleotide-binding protein containing TIR-like domain-containing protein [Vibrio tapetis subsp. tapetis]
MKPKLFIGSSVEGLSVAYAIQQNLTHDTEATVWDQGVFDLSDISIVSLEKTLDTSDFGVFVFSPDDITIMRDKKHQTVRDNVIFEFGLFIGKLGRERVFFVLPEGSEAHIPTDLLGVTPGKYQSNREDGRLQAATGAACNQIRQSMKKLGLINPIEDNNESSEVDSPKNEPAHEWLSDLFDSKFVSAKTKLDTLMKGMSGDELEKHKLWGKYLDFKENDFKGLQPLLDKIKSQDILSLQVLGLQMLMWEKYEDVTLDLIKELFGDSPTEYDIQILKADCLNLLGETQDAIDFLVPAAISHPSLAIKLSELYEGSDNSEEALKTIHYAYREYPANQKVVYRYARLLQDAEEHKEAIYLFNYLTIQEPDNIEYQGSLSNSCLRLDLYDTAMVTSKTALELSKENAAWVSLNVGNMLNNKGFYTDSIEWLNKGLKLDSSSEYGHKRLSSAVSNRTTESNKFKAYCKEGRTLIRNKYLKPSNPV